MKIWSMLKDIDEADVRRPAYLRQAERTAFLYTLVVAEKSGGVIKMPKNGCVLMGFNPATRPVSETAIAFEDAIKAMPAGVTTRKQQLPPNYCWLPPAVEA